MGNKVNWRGTPKERFFRFVKKTPTCWMWVGAKYKEGYGEFMLDSYPVRAHRFSYELHKGKIKKGLIVCHSCDVPECVNPDHLWVGTYSQNVRDKYLKGRASDRKGDKSPTAKLNWSKINRIRRLYNDGWSQTKIADKFSVTQSSISQIVLNKTWV